MIKKTIDFVNFDGSRKTETFYFNLTKAELMEFEISEPGGMRKRLQAIGESKDPVEILGMLRRIIQISIGEKRPDGKFIKTDDFANAFLSSDAYSELFLNLMSDVTMAVEFMNGLLPAELVNEVTKAVSNRETSETEVSNRETPEKDILNGMSPEEIEDLKRALLAKED